MSTPDEEVQFLRQHFLEGENAEFLKDVLVFSVALRIVEHDDPDLLDKMPSWVEDGVLEMVQHYRIDGSYKVISNLGEADHTEMVRKLSELMRLREGQGR